MPILTTAQLVECLELTSVGDDEFEGANLPLEYHRIFGGQLLAQLLAAAAASAPDKEVKSVHAIFCREGDGDRGVRYTVDRQQDGRTFATRAVTAAQGDRVICSAAVSLHAPDEDTLGHQSVTAPTAPPGSGEEVDLGMVPFETRIPGGVDFASTAVEPARLQLWLRADELAGEQLVHQALFAYATDLTLIGTALRPIEGVSQADAHVSLQTAVVTHTVWFHRPVDLAAGLVVDQQVPILRGGRAFGMGHAFAPDGSLVASFAQESLIRPAKH